MLLLRGGNYSKPPNPPSKNPNWHCWVVVFFDTQMKRMWICQRALSIPVSSPQKKSGWIVYTSKACVEVVTFVRVRWGWRGSCVNCWRAALPTWPKTVVWRNTNRPASFWASVGGRLSVVRICCTWSMSRCTLSGQGANWKPSVWMSKFTPSKVCLVAGGVAFLGFVLKPREALKRVKQSKPVDASEWSSTAAKSST